MSTIPPHMNPMTPVEVTELLGSTLHGELPRDTQQRIFATLAEWEPIVRAVKAEAVVARQVVAMCEAAEEAIPERCPGCGGDELAGDCDDDFICMKCGLVPKTPTGTD